MPSLFASDNDKIHKQETNFFKVKIYIIYFYLKTF